MGAELVDAAGVVHAVEAFELREPIACEWQVSGTLAVEESDLSDPSGRAVFRWGGAEWSGALLPEFGGEWGARRAFRLVAGAAGWRRLVRERGYHSDAGVKGRRVAQELAEEVGESLGGYDGRLLVGADYARPVGCAAVTLEDLAGPDRAWWVDRAGVTHVGARRGGFWAGVLDWDPGARVAVLEADDLASLEVGATLTDERIGDPTVIQELVLTGSGAAVRALAWCGGDGRAGRAAWLVRSIVARLAGAAGPAKLFGSYRYRVAGMHPDGRVNLSVVSKATGLPALLPVRMWPGVAGAHAELKPGTEVLVEFEEGDRGRPFVGRFAPKDGAGFVPEVVRLCEGTRGAAGVGDSVDIFVDPGVPIAVTGELDGVPFVGAMTIATPLIGIIGAGTSKVMIP